MLGLLKAARNTVISGKSKILKYVLYAVGEILLVVIGILIAVNVDNWNERRKKAEAFREIVGEIAKDLEKDLSPI